MKAVSELLSHAFRWLNRQNKSDLLRFIEWCSVLQLSQMLILNLRPTEETAEAPRGNKLTGVTDLLPPGALKPTVNWDGFTWITMTWRTFQAAPGFSRSLASLIGVFHCLPAPACLQQGWRATLSPRQMFGFRLLRSVQTEDPSPPLLSCIQKSRCNGCTASKPASQGRPAGEARWRLLCSSCRSEICCSSQPFTVIVLGQSVCTLGKRGRRQQERFFYTERTTQEQSVLD